MELEDCSIKNYEKSIGDSKNNVFFSVFPVFKSNMILLYFTTDDGFMYKAESDS